MIQKLAGWWCRHFHGGIYWPIRGRYRCSVCLRTWQVPWEQDRAVASEVRRPALLAQQHLAR
jgi:hypothetical protein